MKKQQHDYPFFSNLGFFYHDHAQHQSFHFAFASDGPGGYEALNRCWSHKNYHFPHLTYSPKFCIIWSVIPNYTKVVKWLI